MFVTVLEGNSAFLPILLNFKYPEPFPAMTSSKIEFQCLLPSKTLTRRSLRSEP